MTQGTVIFELRIYSWDLIDFELSLGKEREFAQEVGIGQSETTLDDL